MKFVAFQNSDGFILAASSEVKELKRRGLISKGSKRLYSFEAEMWEEAAAIHFIRRGYTPYHPVGTPSHCPRCHAVYYPEGSGQCWKCKKPASRYMAISGKSEIRQESPYLEYELTDAEISDLRRELTELGTQIFKTDKRRRRPGADAVTIDMVGAVIDGIVGHLIKKVDVRLSNLTKEILRLRADTQRKKEE